MNNQFCALDEAEELIGNIGKVGLRLEWEAYNNTSFSRTDVFSIGIQYRFGR